MMLCLLWELIDAMNELSILKFDIKDFSIVILFEYSLKHNNSRIFAKTKAFKVVLKLTCGLRMLDFGMSCDGWSNRVRCARIIIDSCLTLGSHEVCPPPYFVVQPLLLEA